MSAGIEIVEGDGLDLAGVMAVMNSAFDSRYGEAWTAAQCAGALSLPGCSLLVARGEEDEIGGFSVVRSVGDEAEILLIATHPDRQRSGIGTRLLEYLIEQLARTGVARVFLEVRVDNPAIEFYKSWGFRQIGGRKNYYRGLDGRLTDAMTLSLQIA